MKLPKSIMVAGSNYSLSYAQGLTESHGAWGLCDPWHQEIKIDPVVKTSKEILKQVLMHEIQHAFQFSSGLGELLDPQAKEMNAQAQATLICGLFDWKFKAGVFQK